MVFVGKRGRSRPRDMSPVTPFVGYPVALVAEWCCVSRRTAALFKSGVRKPGRHTLRLFELHRDARVLGDEWLGWGVRGNTLFDPENNVTTQGQLRGYALVIRWVVERARLDREAAALVAGVGVTCHYVGGSGQPPKPLVSVEEFGEDSG